MMALLAVGCGSPAASTDDPLEEITRRGVIRAGIRSDNPPHSFIESGTGNWVGFDPDIAEAVAEQLGVRLEKVKVDELTRISYLENGRIDIAVASMSHTRKREDTVDFSQTYFLSRQTFLVQAGKISSLRDLSGKRVGVDRGSSAAGNWRDWLTSHGYTEEPEIVQFSDKQLAAEAVRQGSIDGWAEDYEVLASYAKGDPSLAILSGESIGSKLDGIGMRENSSNLRDAINYALQDIAKSGVYHQIYDRWFGKDSDTPIPLDWQMEIWPNG